MHASNSGPDLRNYYHNAKEHLRKFFVGHEVVEERFTQGPMGSDLDFHVTHIFPGAVTSFHCYCTIGASCVDHSLEQIEFFILSTVESATVVQLLTMLANYHRFEHLGMGHTLSIGHPWLPGSSCDCFFISLPYTFGPKLEILCRSGGHTRFLWVIPITADEREYAKLNGVEALEQRFDAAPLPYWDLNRSSVV